MYHEGKKQLSVRFKINTSATTRLYILFFKKKKTYFNIYHLSTKTTSAIFILYYPNKRKNIRTFTLKLWFIITNSLWDLYIRKKQ